ncbi:carboxylesterase family protein [Macrococcus capreoli]
MINKIYSNVEEWLGVPYATAKRFQKPEIKSFDESMIYDKNGPAAMQNINIEWLNSELGTSETPLNLNIWRPKNYTEPLPVVVYIHGGGFEYGSNSQDTSNLAGMVATEQVIGVSINYRLGIFGWLSLAQYGEPFKDTSNLGLQDVIAALEWIQGNIHHFGGDNKNITVQGHSAGSFISTALLGAPQAKGLFHKLLLFSSSASRIIPQWWAEEMAHRVVKSLGIEDNPEKLLEIDANELMQAFAQVQPRDFGETHGIDNRTIGIVYDRALDNNVLTKHPLESIQDGDNKDIVIVLSTTTAEVDWYAINTPDSFKPENYEEVEDELVNWLRVTRTKAKEIVAFYKQDFDPMGVKSKLYTDYCFLLPAARLALAHAKNGGTAYLLTIGPTENNPAVHGTELYGIVGAENKNATNEQKDRDQFITDTVLNIAQNKLDAMWPSVKNSIYSMNIGNVPYDGNEYAKTILQLFENIDRP